MIRAFAVRGLVIVAVLAAAAWAVATPQAAPPTPDNHCSPVARAPVLSTYSVRSYGGMYCPGGSGHAVGFNLILLECSNTSIYSCYQVDNVGYNFSEAAPGYTLRYGNLITCYPGFWYRSRSRITVLGTIATSSPYRLC